MHLGSRAACGRLVLRTALVAAIALPAALPAVAAQEMARPLQPSARFAQARSHVSGSALAQRLIHSHRAHRAAKTAHFNFPYGLAADAFGNVYVTNYEANTVSVIGANLKATAGIITQGLSLPISIAVDPVGSVFVGNATSSSTGYITKFTNAQPVLTIETNATDPGSIAVDQFDDLYIISYGGIAADDAYGNSIFASEYAGYNLYAVAVGNTGVYAFNDNSYLFGNGSYLLRTDGLQSIVGPAGAVAPAGAACGDGLCWYSDSATDTLWVNNGSNPNSVNLGYVPTGVAYDQLHNRVFVADPLNNVVHIYNAQTLAFEKTIT